MRATALRLLAYPPESESVEAVLAALGDPDALVRMAAVEAAENLPSGGRWRVLEPLLRDPILAVRIEAGRILAPLRGKARDAGARAQLAEAIAEYREAQALNADRAESHVNLGILNARLGEHAAARRAYETALHLAPYFVPAAVNLAELLRLRGRDDEGESVLRAALVRAPESGALHHALGLLLVRRRLSTQAMPALGRAAALEPRNARYAYVYGVALHSAGDEQQALEVLGEAHRVHPGDEQILLALATLHRDMGDREAALRHARRLERLRPESSVVRLLLREIEALEP